MICPNCQNEIANDAVFCPMCGGKIATQKTTMQLKCKTCGGVLSMDEDHPILACPFCGSKELINESDDVTIQRIKSKTYKDVEFERMHQAVARDMRNQERADKWEKENQLLQFRKGKSSKVIIFLFVICLIAAFTSFSNGKILAGLIALIQTALLATAWLMGMQYIKEKIPRLHILLLAVSVILILLYAKVDDIGARNKRTGSPSISQNQKTDEKEGIYTYLIRDYVGKNLASFGDTYGSYRVDKYGAGMLRLSFVAPDGMYIPIDNEEQLKQYKVIAQNVPENTDITIVHVRNSKGEPYSNVVDYQSIEEIVLYVDTINGNASVPSTIGSIRPSYDRRTCYVRDYSGRNAATIGSSYGKDRVDEYFSGKLRLVFNAEDGSFVDDDDLNILKQYRVVGQDINPNDEFSLIYETNSKGEEYDNVIRSQSLETITLTVEKIDAAVISRMPYIGNADTDTNENQEVNIESTEGANEASISNSANSNDVSTSSDIDSGAVDESDTRNTTNIENDSTSNASISTSDDSAANSTDDTSNVTTSTASESKSTPSVILPETNSKLSKDYDMKGEKTIYYINVDGTSNKPKKTTWKTATVTDGVAEYLDYLEKQGCTVSITSIDSRTPYAGFNIYEAYFKATNSTVSWEMYLTIQEEDYVEYEFDITLP